MNGVKPPSGGNGGRDGGGDSRTATMPTVSYLSAPTPPDPGWQAPAPPPLPPHAPVPPPITRSRSRLRRGLFRLLVVASVVVALGGVIYAVVTYQNQSQPGAVVQSYLSALARGDAPAALSYGEMPTGPQGLLTSAVLRKQNAIAPMTNIAIVAATPSGNVADVSVRYTLTFAGAPTSETDTIRVVRDHHTWRLAAVAVPLRIQVPAAGDRAELDGARVPTDSQLYFPGALPLTFDTSSLQVPLAQRVVRFANPTTLTLSVELSSSGYTAVWTALDKALQQCLAGTFPALTSCPLPSTPTAVPGTLRGTTTYTAQVKLDRMAVTVNQPDGGLHIESQADITGTYQQLDFDNLPQATPFNGTLSLIASSSAVAPSTIVWTVL
jgi:hypothetical protein